MQIVWLVYQTYVAVVMHLNRLAGHEAPGRMERVIARELANGKKIMLLCAEGEKDGKLSVVEVALTSEEVAGIGKGRKRVLDLSAQYEKESYNHLKTLDNADDGCRCTEAAAVGK